MPDAGAVGVQQRLSLLVQEATTPIASNTSLLVMTKAAPNTVND
jgi:hypothetical protein